MAVQFCENTKSQSIVYFKWVNFMVGELYHKKGVKKEKKQLKRNGRNSLELKSMEDFWDRSVLSPTLFRINYWQCYIILRFSPMSPIWFVPGAHSAHGSPLDQPVCL